MSANEFLPARYVEHVERLALGIEPVDPMHGMRVPWSVEVALDGVPTPLPRRLWPPGTGTFATPDALRRIGRRSDCRYAILLSQAVKAPVGLRLQDRAERCVPRRLSITLPAPPAGRVCRPALYPGAAYDVVPSAPALRGRVLRAGEPMRWTRVEAQRVADGFTVGTAHGDAHGEFLLLLDPAMVLGPALTPPLQVHVTIYGPDTAPDPAADPTSAVDPLWDLPVEPVDLTAAGDVVLAGTQRPAGYRAGSDRDVTIVLDGFKREEFDFS